MFTIQFWSVITLLAISLDCISPAPFSSNINDSGDFVDSEISIKSEPNVMDNLVQSFESSGSEADENVVGNLLQISEDSQSTDTSNKRYFGKDSEGKQRFSKFYHHGTRSVTPSDSIVFPSASSNVEEYKTYNRGFSDRYNKHRPNIPTPQVGIPFNFGFALPFPTTGSNGNPSSNTGTYINRSSQPQRQTSNYNNDFLTREQDDLLYRTLVQLFQGLFSPQQNSNRSFRTEQQPSYSRTFTTVVAPTPEQVVEELDGVNYQSLYSGPRVQKSPCPNGMHRTHGGSCHEKGRRLLNING